MSGRGIRPAACPHLCTQLLPLLPAHPHTAVVPCCALLMSHLPSPRTTAAAWPCLRTHVPGPARGAATPASLPTCMRDCYARGTVSSYAHFLCLVIQHCNIKHLLQLRSDQMKHLHQTLATYIYDHCKICNNQIKHFHHTFKTYETYTCNIRV
jgi:hypothetical protein